MWSIVRLGLALAAAAIAACNVVESSEDTPVGSSGTGAEGGATSGDAGGGPATSASATTTASSGGTTGSGGMNAKSPGAIACGAETCDTLTQKCCAAPDGAGTCISLADTCGPSLRFDYEFDEMKCDDAADCTGGQICCLDLSKTAPAKISYECSPGPCNLHEACIPGGVCSSGFQCVADAQEPSGARCVAVDAAVTCDAATCIEPAGVCCLDAAPTCGSYDASCSLGLECDDSADCGAGYVCCGSSGTSACASATTCKGVRLCATDGECAANQTCLPASALDGYPASVKLCQ